MFRVSLLVVSAILATASRADQNSTAAARALQTFRKFSDCEVDRHPKEAAAVVLSVGGNILREHSTLFEVGCMEEGRQLTIREDYVRYGFAEALVRRELAGGLPPDIGDAAPLVQATISDSNYEPKPEMKPDELAQLAKDRQKAIALNALSIYGECVARSDPAHVFLLVLSDAGSAAEAQAFNSIGPALSSCLSQGQKIDFGKATLRGTLAVNLYRLAKAPRSRNATR